MDAAGEYRERFRQAEIPHWYRGWIHFGFTSTISLAIVAVCIARLEAVTPWEWLTVPLTFLYANLAEYWGHRVPMHRPVPGLGLIFRRHAGQHHRFFTHQRMEFESSRDFKAVLFPSLMIVFFFGVFGLPVGLLLAWLTSPNVGYLYVATAVGYFLNYEWLHFAYHCRSDSWIRRVPGVPLLRRLHHRHHDPALMQHYNFNITYPIGDWLFGTRYRSTPDRAAGHSDAVT